MDKKIALYLWICAALPALACNPNPDIPAPRCGAEVRACGLSQTREGTQCARCDDENSSLTCTTDGRHYATCVARCDSCDTDPPYKNAGSVQELATLGVHVCDKVFREGSWCATCDSYNLSLATALCDHDGFCPPVVCVRTCDTCETVKSGSTSAPRDTGTGN